MQKSRKPECVVLPIDEGEMVRIVELCARRRKPVVARGTGTGLGGGCIAHEGGVVVNTRLMCEIDDVNVRQNTATVGPGVLKNELNEHLKKNGFGLVFGPDPSSNPTIGGMASTGGSGLSTLKYGTSKENVVAMRVVLPNGKVITTRRGRTRRGTN